MAYGVIWQYSAPEDGKVRKLMSSPSSVAEITTETEAKKEGIQMLNEIAPEQKVCLKPLAIVEVTEEMLTSLELCPQVTMPMVDDDGDDLEFVDVGETEFWTSQGWWHRHA